MGKPYYSVQIKREKDYKKSKHTQMYGLIEQKKRSLKKASF